mmetsp:Transcript_20972/g.58367  ORF Transcript_20972/g.58367 Transcript_20972/m.58367 type:complete len:82 (-) Transcript_20972:1740-1985(-)
MAEYGGETELQMLEAEIRIMTEKLRKARGAEKTSASCARIVSSVVAAEVKDGFVLTEGGSPNLFHTSAGSSAGGDGCCTVS